MNIRINRKTQFKAILMAIADARQIDESMMADKSIDLEDRMATLERIGHLFSANLIIQEYQEKFVDGRELSMSVSDDVYSAVSYAVNVACDIYSDNFSPKNLEITDEAVDLLIDLNRLDVQLN